MPLLFLRHGQSEANANHIFAGQQEDSPLTALGVEQARQAGNGLAGRRIDLIIASKLERTHRTATEVARTMGIGPRSIVTDDRIMEYDMGALTGVPIRKLTSRERTSYPGAEDPDAFRDRVISFFTEYHRAPGTTLVVSHAGVGRALEAARRNVDPSDFYNLSPYPNASVVELDLEWLP